MHECLAWNLDGGSNTAESTTGTATTSPISMGTYHTVTFNSVTQYQVTLDSGATAALSSITSPTVSGDNYWYDSGTTVTISLKGVWGRSGGSGTRLSNYALNGGSNIPTYTTSAFNVFSGPLSSHEYVTTTTVTQYFLTVTGGNSVCLWNSINDFRGYRLVRYWNFNNSVFKLGLDHRCRSIS